MHKHVHLSRMKDKKILPNFAASILSPSVIICGNMKKTQHSEKEAPYAGIQTTAA